MRIISLIPARGGSKRIPGKNIKDFCGKPLIAHTIEKCLSFSDQVWVSSDSDEILEVSKLYGSSVLKRPIEISSENSTPKEYIKHFFDSIEVFEDDIVVLCQPTSPLVTKEYYLRGIDKYKHGKYDVVFSVFEDKRRIWDENCSVVEVNKKWYGENGAFYIFSKQNFIDNGTILFGNACYILVPKLISIDIDEEDDFFLAKLLYRELEM